MSQVRASRSKPLPNQDEAHFIEDAARYFESPNLAIRALNLLGQPIEALEKKLPESLRKKLSILVQRSLKNALIVAIQTIDQEKTKPFSWQGAMVKSQKSVRIHTAGVALSGAIGGAFGFLALPLELSISTTLMLRGISDVASKWGMDLRNPEVQLQCLYVFTLGSPRTNEDDDMDSNYLSSRLAFEQVMRSASAFMAQKSASQLAKALDAGAAPLLLRLITGIAKPFELALTEKLLTESVPLIGAVGGAVINALFCDYFTEAARYHFGLLQLEEKYGRDQVQSMFSRARPSMS